MLSVAQHAMDYASRGWRVVALHYPGEYRKGHPDGWVGKEPCVGEGWQAKATTDEGQITEWFDQNPKANVGVAFGRQSGIIDIECDDEAAAQNFDRIFAGLAVVTPTFKSSKGLHRIFKWTDSFPSQGKASIKKGGLEFRLGDSAKGSQSVFPPSLHATGVRYQWLPGLSPSECDPMEIPLEILARISVFIDEGEVATPSLLNGRKAKPQSHWDELLCGVSEGGRNSAAAELAGWFLSQIDVSRGEEVREKHAEFLTWNQRNNPPLSDQELEATWESILDTERLKRVNRRSSDRIVNPPAGNGSEWRAVFVESNPPVWKLFSPHWDGFVKLTMDEWMSARLVEKAAIRSKRKSFDYGFAATWEGSRKEKRGLRQMLTETATTEEPALEDCRDRVVASLIWSQHLGNATEAEEPEANGRPRKMKDNSVWFKTEYLLTNGGSLKDYPDRSEINEVLRACGVTDKVKRQGSKTSKYRVLNAAGMTALENLAHKGATE